MGHTKGPWYFRMGTFQGEVSSETTGKTIAVVYTDEADGQLIEAAPDLLNTCRYLVDNCENEEDDGYNDSEFIEQVFIAIRMAKDAISKAEGKS